MSRKSTLMAVVIALAVGATVAYAGSGDRLPHLGPVTKKREPTFKGFYDGHKDIYLITDVSSKAQASSGRMQVLSRRQVVRNRCSGCRTASGIQFVTGSPPAR